MQSLYRFLVLCCLTVTPAFADSGPTESWQVLSYVEGQSLPKANLKIMEWKLGGWHWQAPMQGQMEGEVHYIQEKRGQLLGLARGYNAENIVFNEITTTTQVGDTIELRLRHFGADLHAWEPQNEPQIRRLLKVTDQAIYFEDHTFVKRNKNHYTLFVRVRHQDGSNEIFKVEHERIVAK